MKILFICFNLVNQGTYWRAYHLGKALVQRGHEVTLIATSRSNRFGIKQELKDGIQVVATPDLFSGSLRSGWDLWNIINRVSYVIGRSFDIVHAFETRPTIIYPALVAKNRGARLFMDWADWFGRGGFVEERSGPLRRAVLRVVETYYEEHFRDKACGNTVICSSLYNRALGLGLPADSLLLLPNGANVESFVPGDRSMARESVSIPEDYFVVGYMGTIFQRDADFMMEAFEKLQEKIPHARLLWIGNAPRHIQSISGKVLRTNYLPTQEHLNQYLSACDVFWMPMMNSLANQGRLPLKLTDYMASGRPIIATAVGDVPDVIQKSNCGLVSPVDVSSFVNCTVTLAEDVGLRKQLGINARQEAEKNYRWSMLAEKLERFYEKEH